MSHVQMFMLHSIVMALLYISYIGMVIVNCLDQEMLLLSEESDRNTKKKKRASEPLNREMVRMFVCRATNLNEQIDCDGREGLCISELNSQTQLQ